MLHAPLRYLIGTDNPGFGHDGEIIEVSYNATKPPRNGLAIAYCNLFDEDDTGRFGPYLHDSDTAEQYHEGQIDPQGVGWIKNLKEQFERRKRQGFKIVELDNPDAYDVEDVVGAVDFAASYGFQVVAKNPLIMNGDPLPYVKHPAICGVIVERGAGSPADCHRLRVDAGKPDLPVWFVSHGAGRAWIANTASHMRPFKSMWASYSAKGEYGSADFIS